MGQRYEQSSLEERCELSRFSQAGETIRQIAAITDRARIDDLDKGKMKTVPWSAARRQIVARSRGSSKQ